tara:strand:- start:1385 stop:1621 length:237 start_codon:yes stop_codon:yes gene_type:complete
MNLAKLARLYVKQQTKDSFEKYNNATLYALLNLAKLVRKYLHHVNKKQIQNAFGGNINLARLARRYLAKCNREEGFKN